MKRLFTFGCSFTQYRRWPTWADALGRQADYYENWGICGGGNAQILYNLMECHRRHNINADDHVMIMWTNTSREDRYVRNRWIEGGNVYWDAGSRLPAGYVKHFACERGYLIRDLAVISAVDVLLKSFKCEHRFFSMVPLKQTNRDNQLGEDPQDTYRVSDVYDLYSTVLDQILPSVLEVVFEGNWWSGNGLPDVIGSKNRDFHPTPLEHLKYLSVVAPDIEITDQTQKWMEQWQSNVKTKSAVWKNQFLPKNRL